MRSAFIVLGLVLGLVACSASGGGSSNGPGAGGGGGSGAASSGGAPGSGGGGISLDAGDDARPTVARLKGKVYSPQGVMPISGALVFLSGGTPGPIPDHAYCDKCVALPHGTPYTFSNPDGSFELDAYATGPQTLVVEKGQFRRYRTIDVVAGDQDVPAALTTMPRKTDPAAGDNIPKMAVIQGQWDQIEVSLAKFGLGEIIPGPFNLGVQVKPGTASFDIITNKLGFLKDMNRLSQYHIVFLPCSGSDGTTCNDYVPGDATVKKNLQDYVAMGGKIYVTDYSYEFVRQPFPGYVDWVGQGAALGSACQGGSYDAPATVKDQGMKDWLAAMGVTTFDVKASWTMIDKVNPVDTIDDEGKPVTVTPKVWVEGDIGSSGPKPTTVSFEYQCGRVLFSTYHTEAGNAKPTSPYLPQEAALMYVLLEVGVCIEPTNPK